MYRKKVIRSRSKCGHNDRRSFWACLKLCGNIEGTEWAQSGHRSDLCPKAKRPASLQALLYLAPQPGLEPGTYGLTVRRSTD